MSGFEYQSKKLNKPEELLSTQPGPGWRLYSFTPAEQYSYPVHPEYPDGQRDVTITEFVAIWEREVTDSKPNYGSCRDCFYFRKSTKSHNFMECRKLSQMVVGDEKDGYDFDWPSPHHDSGCGEFRPKAGGV